MASAKTHEARTMMTEDEIKNHVPPFLSRAWQARVERRAKREYWKANKELKNAYKALGYHPVYD